MAHLRAAPLFVAMFRTPWDLIGLDVSSEHQHERFSGFLLMSLEQGHHGGLSCLIRFEEFVLRGHI